MRINLWHTVGRKNAPKDVIDLRRLPASRATELRAAIKSARSGDGDADAVVFVIERGYSARGRAIARVVVGAGVVVAMLAAVAAFVAPDAAGTLVGVALIPAVLVSSATAALSARHDTGIELRANGVLRREGWSGIREYNVRDYPRVTVAEPGPSDAVAPVEG